MKEKIWSIKSGFTKPKGFTPRYSIMHTAESNYSNFVIEYLAKSKPNSKYFALFIRGPDAFESSKKIEVENLVTHSL